MKICIISPRYPYRDNNEFVFVSQLIKQWADNGAECTVISPFSLSSYARGKASYAPSRQVDHLPSGKTVHIERPRFISLPPSIRIFGITLTTWFESRTIYRSLKRHSPDIVYCHFLSSGIAAWKYASEHGVIFAMALGESEFPFPGCPSRHYSLERFRQDMHHVVCVSSENMHLASEAGYISIEKSKVFPNGTDLSLFRPVDRGICRDKLEIDRNAFLIVSVGYFIERKGQKRIIEALKRIADSNIKAEFIGTGPDELEYDGIVVKRSVPHSDLYLYLNAADVFVLPTLHEGCCNSIVEAMACRLPIVSSDRGFNKDILNEKNSIMVDPTDIGQIATAIMRLRDDTALRESLAQAAFERAQELSIAVRARNILSFISAE